MHVGPFELDRADRTLRRDGQVLPIGSRGFDILDRLAEADGAGIPAEQLHRAVWAGRAVGQNNLRVQISLLRRVLGAHAVRHDFARGYWLALPVRAGIPEGQSQTPGEIRRLPVNAHSGNSYPSSPWTFGFDDERNRGYVHGVSSKHFESSDGSDWRGSTEIDPD